MTELTYKQAINKAMADALEADDSVFLLGEDVAAAGGAFKTTEGLLDRFGPKRVLDTPISEQAIVGTAIGAAARGLRPVAEVMFADFSGVCFDQIGNQLAKYRYMTGGQVSVPVTIRMANGAGTGFAAQHSQAVENWFLNIPGIKLVVPGTPSDAYHLLRAAIEDPDPVLYFEHKALFNIKGEVAGSPTCVRLGVADTVRQGGDITVVTTQLLRHRALEAAEALAQDGIEVTLIDPRTVVPLDFDTIARSVEATGRLIVVQEGPPNGGWGASVIARVCSDLFEMLDAPPHLQACDETPVPYAGPLEESWLPSVERIADAIRQVVES